MKIILSYAVDATYPNYICILPHIHNYRLIGKNVSRLNKLSCICNRIEF